MIDEIKNAPEYKLIFQQGSYNFFMGWHTGITNHEKAVANILKPASIGSSMSYMPLFKMNIWELAWVILGPVKVYVFALALQSRWRATTNIKKVDWTEISLLPKTISMIMAISQRVFVGEPLCRLEQCLSRNRPERYKMLIARSCILHHASNSKCLRKCTKALRLQWVYKAIRSLAPPGLAIY